MTPSSSRRVEVDPSRLDRWVAGFAARHGALSWSVDGPSLRLHGEDGHGAVMTSWRPAELARDSSGSTVAELLPDLPTWAAPATPLALLLVRRGGYAVGLAERGRLVSHKVGTRRVQGRSAAGGWSQQRFARRRSHQADALVEALAGHAQRVLDGVQPAGLVVGGDRLLLAQLGQLAPLARWGEVPRRTLLDLPDPRRAVLDEALRRGVAVLVDVTEPTQQ